MGHRFAVLLLLCLGASLLHAGELPKASAMEALDDVRIIKTGDLLSIHIIKASKEPEIITVGGNGEIKHLVLLKPMPAAGLTCRTLAFNIGRQLERDYFGGPQIVLVKFASSMDVLDNRHIIVPGDTVSIRVLEDRREAEQRRVPESGMIEFRFVGAVRAGGLTCRKLAMLIRQRLPALPAPSPPTIGSEAPTVLVAIDRTTCGLPSMDDLDNNLQLQPGWTLEIRIVEDKREKLLSDIASNGEVQAPYIGLVKAAGLTCAELAAKIKQRLEKNFFEKATVLVTLNSNTVRQFESTRCIRWDFVVAFGKVSREGKYDLPESKDLTVSGFVKRSGGYTGANAVPKIKIVRRTPKGSKTILVDTHAIWVGKSKEHDLFLRENDVMVVE